MRIFISGRMSGVKDLNKPAFNAKAKELTAAGFTAVNPAGFEKKLWFKAIRLALYGVFCLAPLISRRKDKAFGECLQWATYLALDILMMCTCGGICQLEGWGDSPGAKIEKIVADRLGLWLIEGK